MSSRRRYLQSQPLPGRSGPGQLGPDQLGAGRLGTRIDHRHAVGADQRHWEAAQDVSVEQRSGGHGGGDALLLADVFRGPAEDWLQRPSSWVDGVRSIAVGPAGHASLRTRLPVAVTELELGVDLSR